MIGQQYFCSWLNLALCFPVKQYFSLFLVLSLVIKSCYIALQEQLDNQTLCLKIASTTRWLSVTNRSVLDRTTGYRETNEGGKKESFCLPCLQSSHVTSILGVHCASFPCNAQYADTATYKMASVVKHQSQAGRRWYLHLL